MAGAGLANVNAAFEMLLEEMKAHILTRDGFMKKDSPRGIWEISDAGWEYLERRGIKPGASGH